MHTAYDTPKLSTAWMLVSCHLLVSRAVHYFPIVLYSVINLYALNGSWTFTISCESGGLIQTEAVGFYYGICYSHSSHNSLKYQSLWFPNPML